MKKILLMACMLVLVNTEAQADTLYRWVDNEGKVHYGDRPEADAARIEQKKFAIPTVSDDDLLPYEARRARQNFPVTLYVSESCGDLCTQARDFLNKRGIPFTEKSLALQAEVEEFKKLSGGDGVPALAVGKKYLNGFEAGLWGSELDIAGYPKTAPYRARQLAPQAKPAQAAPSVAPAAPAE